MKEKYGLIPSENKELIEASGVTNLLSQIRPEWQGKNLIHRVNRVLQVDPSSACQRLFNASIHDLREKIVIAGLDIAKEAARQNKLPQIEKAEDVENLSTSRIIELAYRIGLLSRSEWRRVLRAYDIRKDLEHEDDEYEASEEDCRYIFKTCIKAILSKDPIHLIRLTDIKNIVSQEKPTALDDGVLEEFSLTPEPRQDEIYKFLISSALNPDLPDVVRQNCYMALNGIRESAKVEVLISSAKELTENIGRRAPSLLEARTAFAGRLLAYLKKNQLREFYKNYYDEMQSIGHSWRNNVQHGKLLRDLEEVGGLDYCHEEYIERYVTWLVRCYIGEPGGRTSYGNIRKVFYSNVGAPLSLSILSSTKKNILDIVAGLEENSRNIQSSIQDNHVARRYHDILDALET